MGPLLQVEISIPSALEQLLAAQNQPIPSPKTGWALIDTGATRTCVDAKTVSALGVNPIGVTLYAGSLPWDHRWVTHEALCC
jgi:hypothetical protein